MAKKEVRVSQPLGCKHVGVWFAGEWKDGKLMTVVCPRCGEVMWERESPGCPALD